METSVVIGPSTNSLTVTRTQLTGLSDACRRHTMTVSGGADAINCVPPGTPLGGSQLAATEMLLTYDPDTGIETETVTSTVAQTIIRRYLHGILFSTETSDETSYNSYDAFARVAATSRTADTSGRSGVSPLQAFTYAPTGDLLATHTYTNGTDCTTETYAYDMLGNRIATTDAHGNTIYKSYDPLGHVFAEWGAT